MIYTEKSLGWEYISAVFCYFRDLVSHKETNSHIAPKYIYRGITKRYFTESERLRKIWNDYSNNKRILFDGKDITDVNIESQLQKLTESLENNFMSEYEIAAQNVIEYIMQSRDTDMLTKLRTLLLDLLITGYTYFRVKPSFNKTNVKIEVLDPLNTFVDSHPESPYAKHASRAVVRKWMTKEQIIAEYGNDLTKDEIKELRESQIGDFDSHTRIVFSPASTGIRAGEEVRPGYPSGEYSRFNNRLIPVYEVEWIETDKDFIMQRYETVKIGAEMYIIRGKNEQVFRTQDNPNLCTLSVNGVYFTNRSNEPYSLVLACADMQDRYNILHFYRDQLIASSGTVGDILDVAMLPEFLGVNLPERIQKWIAYKKTGTALIDSSQEGRLANGGAALNTIFNGFDDTIKVQSIQAIQMAIESIENTTSSITGVFRERLNGIEQRDAVTNVKQSANNSFIITKHYYQQMDLVVTEILMDALNCGKIVFKKGLKGSIILGDYQQKIFTALPEHFTTSDHDIRILTSTEIIQDMQQIKTLVPELMKVGTIDPQIIFDAITSTVVSFKPKFKIVSIIPGIDTLAPERTETNKGSLASPNFLPATTSNLAKASSISAKI